MICFECELWNGERQECALEEVEDETEFLRCCPNSPQNRDHNHFRRPGGGEVVA